MTSGSHAALPVKIDESALFSFPAVPASLAGARNVIRGVLAAEKRAQMEMDILIAAGEVMQNVIRYGYAGGDEKGVFSVGVLCREADVIVIITDKAPPSDPASWSASDRRPEEGGHGLALVRQIASETCFLMLEDGNLAQLRFEMRQNG